MLQRVRQQAIKLHEDESAPNTVEWVLLIIIGLIILIAVFIFAQFVLEQFQDRRDAVQDDAFVNTTDNTN